MKIDFNLNNYNYNIANTNRAGMPQQNNDIDMSKRNELPRIGSAFKVELSGNNKDDQKTTNIVAMKAEKTAKTECATCASRKYVDESGDAGVSFKSPATVAPEAAASAVKSHEQEHVTIAKARSDEQNTSDTQSEVISNVRIFTSVCPECGKTYVSGGETQSTTIIKTKQPSGASSSKGGIGENVDIAA